VTCNSSTDCVVMCGDRPVTLCPDGRTRVCFGASC
jgi:hypothetical protein